MRGRIILPLEDNLKRTIFAAALSFMAAAAAFSMEIEKPFFSGTTGFFASIASNKDKDSFDAECNAESYFAGLFDFLGCQAPHGKEAWTPGSTETQGRV